MLNKAGQRELAYVIKIDNIMPITGADNICLACANGWQVIVKKTEFNIGDKAVFFEIDSKVPADEERYAFLSKRGYKIKTMKLNRFGVFSQGLLMPMSEFPELGDVEVGTPLTEKLHVRYAVEEDNARKSNTVNNKTKYQAMSARHKDLFKKKPFRWLMRREWGRKLLFIFFGKKKDNPRSFPTKFPYVKRSDEERVENMPYILQNKEPWVRTQKIDGTSSTYILERIKKNKFEEYVCSRNVRQLTPSQENFHKDIEGNVYWQMADKYHIFDFLKKYLIENNLDYVALQGETAGPNIQGNPHKFKEIRFFGYNFIRSDIGRMGSVEASRICEEAGIPWVPIADEAYILPDDMEIMKLSADGPCIVGEGPREGWVYRSQDGKQSFKNVSREYLLKHG